MGNNMSLAFFDTQKTSMAGDWDYRTANTKQFTHGIHSYPAMMIPQVAQRLVESYGKKHASLFDPYCGSGTTLLEGMLAEMTAVGTDLNPLARLIAQVKTTMINIDDLDDEIESFPRNFSDKESLASIVSFPNIDYWFSPEIQRSLSTIKGCIDSIDNIDVANIFRVAFSLTVRKTSWTRNSEFKLYRIPTSKMLTHNLDALSVMIEAVTKIRNALTTLNNMNLDLRSRPKIYNFNSVLEVPKDKIAHGSFDLVITSPPYGDSRTTVAYGQFSRLSSQWLGFPQAERIDNILMGGSRLEKIPKFNFPKLDSVISKIAKKDEHRACEVASFFQDYRSSISNISSSMKRGAFVCYVVGNRTVKNYTIPTAESTSYFFEENGFKTVDVHERNIPNKRMPSTNSPSNISGQIGKTMTTEKIIICRKKN